MTRPYTPPDQVASLELVCVLSFQYESRATSSRLIVALDLHIRTVGIGVGIIKFKNIYFNNINLLYLIFSGLSLRHYSNKINGLAGKIGPCHTL